MRTDFHFAFTPVRRVVSGVFFLLVSLLCLQGAPSSVFVPARVSALVEALPAPLADDSLTGQADLETLLQVQADRTPAQEARARRAEKHTVFVMGASVFGAWFTAENLPLTAHFFETAGVQFHPALVSAKKRWQRPRPFVRDTRVHPCLAAPAGTSYPSGHSATAAIWGELLSAVFPEKRTEFMAQVRETMWSRVLAGVHFPTDTQAGRQLGESIGREMLALTATQLALEAVHQEIEDQRRKFLSH